MQLFSKFQRYTVYKQKIWKFCHGKKIIKGTTFMFSSNKAFVIPFQLKTLNYYLHIDLFESLFYNKTKLTD